MKSVQEYLKEIDTERLVNEYLYAHPIQLHEVMDENIAVKKIKELAKAKLRKYIERLQSLEIEPSEDGREYVLFVHKTLKDGFGEETYLWITCGCVV